MITLIKTIAQGTYKCTHISFECFILLFDQDRNRINRMLFYPPHPTQIVSGSVKMKPGRNPDGNLFQRALYHH